MLLLLAEGWTHIFFLLFLHRFFHLWVCFLLLLLLSQNTRKSTVSPFSICTHNRQNTDYIKMVNIFFPCLIQLFTMRDYTHCHCDEYFRATFPALVCLPCPKKSVCSRVYIFTLYYYDVPVHTARKYCMHAILHVSFTIAIKTWHIHFRILTKIQIYYLHAKYCFSNSVFFNRNSLLA